ncbi:restriction endonuclease subunit S [Klebsiella michiganensis]|uniref:Restriction endonuclease subunit S n=1 Tax=Klebsiella michiganensis TaxID=1134687 RepID=A0A2J4RA23_9ENTR|nr:restriction endonuclease subunit S [Klebsiella michiganensis]PLL40166.1 restriction endonuclease subunit S [Klebsiella michiganensis]
MNGGKLPEGWVDTQLGNIIDYGKATKRVLSDVNDDTWVLELEDIEKESSKLLSTIRAGERPFKSTKNSFKKGDVLYGKLRPYLNKIILAEEDGVCTTEIIPLSAEPSCCNKYIFYWLKSSTFLGYVNEVSYGVNMPRLGTADGLKAPLRLAPLAEQKIIAEKLDTLLAQVDSTKARLEQIPQILKRFRQAVLTIAMSGKLTNLPTANNFKIKDIACVIGGLTKNSKRNNFEKKVPYLRVANVYENELKLDDVTEIGIQPNELRRVSLEYEDLLIVEGNGSLDQIGRAAIWREEIQECVHQNHLIKVRANKEILYPTFLLFYFMSPQGKEEIVSRATSGAGLYTLSISKISSINVPVYSLPDQQEIVRRVEQLFAYADTIEKQVNNALTRVNSLTQSILAKAFRGELTAQWRAENHDLISGENSAAALLEKIKAERAASGGKKNTRKKA